MALSWARISGSFRITPRSESSSSRRDASTPVSSRLSRTTRARSSRTSWQSETLTATRQEGRPCFCHDSICRQAARSTHLPIATMSPASSASGTNSEGGTSPSSGLSSGRSASAARTREEDPSTSGWKWSRSSPRASAIGEEAGDGRLRSVTRWEDCR